MWEETASGHRALEWGTALLQRARRSHPTAGLWEASDLQWWWREPRPSDDVAKTFWFDDDGPIAGALLTSFSAASWQADPVLVSGANGPDPAMVWQQALVQGARYAPAGFDVPVQDGDERFGAFVSALAAGDRDSTGWLDPARRPAVLTLPDGFVLTDRTQRQGTPHPLARRNGEGVEARLRECSRYDPWLDLSVETTDGTVAAYALHWFDPATGVGMTEPVRVEQEFQRRGLARAMLAEGLDRLARRGATRLKVSWESEAAGALYTGLGFRPTSTSTWYWIDPAHVI